MACIAEGELVLTNKGLVPIEKIKKDHLLWDGESWVHHDGLIYRGKKEVIEYDGLKATEDHPVFIEGCEGCIPFGVAKMCGAPLFKMGDSWGNLWPRCSDTSSKRVERKSKSYLCSMSMQRLRRNKMDLLRRTKKRNNKRVSALFSAKTDSHLAEQKINSCKK